MYCVYILKCADGSLYTGYTNDLKKRLLEHDGDDIKGAKYTRSRRPVTLVFEEKCSSKEAAMRREYAIKQLSRSEKVELITKK